MTYLIGQDKVLVKVNSPQFEGWVECDDIEQLKEEAASEIGDKVKEGFVNKRSKIPAEKFEEVLGTIHEFPHMETSYVLEWRASDNTWNIACPEQKGSGAFVEYDDTQMHEGYEVIGTLHTHPEMRGKFSGVDDSNNRRRYGLHIVLGLHEGKPKDWQVKQFTRWNEFEFDLWDIVEKVDMNGDYQPNSNWVELIKKRSYVDRSKKDVWDKDTGEFRKGENVVWDHNTGQFRVVSASAAQRRDTAASRYLYGRAYDMRDEEDRFLRGCDSRYVDNGAETQLLCMQDDADVVKDMANASLLQCLPCDEEGYPAELGEVMSWMDSDVVSATAEDFPDYVRQVCGKVAETVMDGLETGVINQDVLSGLLAYMAATIVGKAAC